MRLHLQPWTGLIPQAAGSPASAGEVKAAMDSMMEKPVAAVMPVSCAVEEPELAAEQDEPTRKASDTEIDPGSPKFGTEQSGTLQRGFIQSGPGEIAQNVRMLSGPLSQILRCWYRGNVSLKCGRVQRDRIWM